MPLILCPGSSVCREKTGIIKLWALWQEWRGRSWIMLHLNLSGEGPRKGPQGRRKMAATIGKSKPNESLSFPDPSLHNMQWPHISCHIHVVITCHILLDFTLQMPSAQIYHLWYTTQCLLCQYSILPPVPQNAPSQANIWKNSYFLGSARSTWQCKRKFRINSYLTISSKNGIIWVLITPHTDNESQQRDKCISAS